MRARLERFMYGRYGQDNLNRLLSTVALILCLVSLFTGWGVLYTLALVLLILSIFRMFSRNINKRRDENLAFLRLRAKPAQFFARIKKRSTQSKTHNFYKCPSCKQELRVPKGKGRISINCPKCHTSFEKTT